MKIKATKRVLLVIDASGRIVASAPVDEAKKGEEGGVGLGALPGQTVHEVPLPKELEAVFAHPIEDFEKALSGYKLRPGITRSWLLPIRAAEPK